MPDIDLDSIPFICFRLNKKYIKMKYNGSFIFGSALIKEIRSTCRRTDFNIFDLHRLTPDQIRDM